MFFNFYRRKRNDKVKIQKSHVAFLGDPYVCDHFCSLYAELLTTGKLNDYLADLNEQAEALFSRLVKQLSEKEGVTEALKAENQMLWVQRMNNIRSAAMEIVSSELIYC